MSKVLVDPAALEEAAKWLEVHSSSSGSAEAFAAEALREAIAQPAEAEGVEVVGVIDEADEGCFVELMHDRTFRLGEKLVRQSDHLAALSAERARADVAVADANDAERALVAVTAERDRLAAALSAPDTIKAEPAGDYDNLRKQFQSLRMLANSNAKMVHYWRAQCDRETRETLLANAASVNAERDTNALLTDSLEAAEAERDRLRAKVERYVPLHEAIQRAAGELPEGWAIQLYIERNGGGVELIGPDGTEDFATNNERLDYTVIDALEAAMAAKEA